MREPFDVRPLLTRFEQTASESVRRAIGNTLAELRPLDVRDWVTVTLARREYGRAREMLPLALARIAPRDVANALLLEHRDDMPGHVSHRRQPSGARDTKAPQDGGPA